MEERCTECGRDVALGAPLYARRVTLLNEESGDVAFVCLDCRVSSPLHDAEGQPLDEDRLAGMKYVIGVSGSSRPS